MGIQVTLEEAKELHFALRGCSFQDNNMKTETRQRKSRHTSTVSVA